MASENYLLRSTLLEIDDPVITRTLSVPKTTTFHKFHEALQIAFGWAGHHIYQFDVLAPLPANHTFRSLPITLLRLEEEPEPPMDFNFSFPRLGLRPEPHRVASTIVSLQAVLDNPWYIGRPIEYHYDFGDGWEHTIEKIGTETGNGVIKCVAGGGHGVAEDCGGTEDWKHLKSMYRRMWQAEDREVAFRNLTKDVQEKMIWYEEVCANGNRLGLDPDLWSMRNVNSRLAREL